MSSKEQQTNSNRFSLIIKKFYLNEDLADFHFLFKMKDGEFERVPAHKLLLTASDVFRTMFNRDWKDKTEVEIVDASAAAFKEFLQFFYLSKVNLTMENISFVINLGKKYDVPECSTVCSKFLTNSITDDNVCTVYGLANFFDQEKLKRYCELVIGTNTNVVLSSNDFLECDPKVLKSILDLDFISCSEADVFEACMNWVKFKSGEDHLTREIVQEHFGELLKELRFKSMSSKEFAMLYPSYGKLFTFDEYAEINQLIALDEFKSDLFSENLRKSIDNLTHDGINISCDRLISKFNSSVRYKIKEVEVTTFSVNEPILLEAIECSVTQHKKISFYNLDQNLATDLEIAQVSEQSDEKILCNQKAHFECKSFTVITLSKPILIRPNLMHEIRFKQTPPANCVAGLLVKSKVHMDSNLTVKFHRDVMVEDDIAARGMVYRLHFKKI